MRALALALIFASFLSDSAYAFGRKRSEFVLSNATFVPELSKHPQADAVMVNGTRIVEIGKSADLIARCQSPCQVVDLGGKFLSPGFHDAHAHPAWGGAKSFELSVTGSDVAAIAAALKKYSEENPGPESKWIRGRGWNAAGFGNTFPTAHDLDLGEAKRPVALSDSDGHQLWVNSEAIRIAGVTRTTPDPPGGRIERDSSGHPTGVFFERARELIYDKMPPYSENEMTQFILKGEETGLDAGISAFHGGPLELVTAKLYRRLDSFGRLTQRAFLWLNLDSPPDEFKRAVEFARSLPEDSKVRVTAFKGFVDGVISSHTAALLEPYEDQPTQNGAPNYSQSTLNDLVLRANAVGFPVALHAIGDRSVRMALDAYENSKKILQHALINRIEHAELIDPMDVPRFEKIGAAASIQPTHMHFDSKDSFYFHPRLGDERMKRLFVWNDLRQGGALLLFGSDFPVVPQDPIEGIHCALNRTFYDGTTFEPTQQVTGAVALDAYTLAPARAAGMEALLGRIEIGYDADFVAFAQDPRLGAASRLAENPPVFLMIAGQIVRERK